MNDQNQRPPVLPQGSQTGGVPPSSDSGQVDGRWHAPHKFSSWLAAQMQDQGAGLSVRVDFRPDGILAFSYQWKKAKVPVFLVVGRRGSKGEVTRFGTLFAPLPCAPEVEKRLLHHTATRLDQIFRGTPPTWLSRRSSPSLVVGWGPSFLQDYCSDLLVPGVTHWGSTLLQDAQFDEDRSLLLSFRGDASFDLRLYPSCEKTNKPWVGQYGPLVLVAPDSSIAAHPFVSYVSFVFSLLIPSGATLLPYDSSQQDWIPLMGDTRGEDTFLVGHFRTSEELYKAIFAAKAKIAVVGNLDRECSSALRWLAGATEDAIMDFWHIHTSREAYMSFRTTDISDTDVVTIDGEARTTELIRQVIDSPLDLLVVQGGCPSALMGETGGRSLDAALEGAQRTPHSFTVDVCLGENTDYRRFWDMLVQMDPAEEPLTVADRLNLVGFGHRQTPALSELLRLLGEAGLSDIHTFLPTFEAASIPGTRSARATVVYPSPHVVDAFSMARRHFGQAVVFPDAPWGIQGTRQWLDQVLRSMGRDGLPDHLWQAMVAARTPSQWAEWRGATAGLRVGFAASAHYFMQPDSHLRHGLPIAQVIQELGFGIDLVVVPPTDTQPRRIPKTTLERWGGSSPGAVRVVYGKHGETLHELLQRCEPVAFYSEWVGDQRLLMAGKEPFSVADLHMGLEGTVRNLRFLLQLSTLPFAQRYGRLAPSEVLHG